VRWKVRAYEEKMGWKPLIVEAPVIRS